MYEYSIIYTHISCRYQIKCTDTCCNFAFSELQLRHLIIELLHAGADPVVSTLRWALYLMARHPDVQKRAQRELDAVLCARAPLPSDRTSLPFIEALLCEVQRLASVCPVAHLRAEEELELQCEHRFGEQRAHGRAHSTRAYRIPSGTFVLANLYGVHRDPALWTQPEGFHVENFYDEASNSVTNQSSLIPFSCGLFLISDLLWIKIEWYSTNSCLSWKNILLQCKYCTMYIIHSTYIYVLYTIHDSYVYMYEYILLHILYSYIYYIYRQIQLCRWSICTAVIVHFPCSISARVWCSAGSRRAAASGICISNAEFCPSEPRSLQGHIC